MFLLVLGYLILHILLAFGVVEGEVNFHCLLWFRFVYLWSECAFLLFLADRLFFFPLEFFSCQFSSKQQSVLHIDFLLRFSFQHHVLHDLIFGPLSE